ncbi:AfsR/SARP family transcriptional regulator [Streptomyces hoynatensis]|uniref:SARP family transcriptional regulator n=1 Tax=Streptomyces hoynatensis TaxID=1141874 RepID=A0A3A9ZF95_9ACTN|nr:BTAD domain-containing putative transcriptional regulator [Streptomyces hoynatensis]RKN47018.1 SARP family transcriptional regulator [Streptomyces hoynatensis]
MTRSVHLDVQKPRPTPAQGDRLGSHQPMRLCLLDGFSIDAWAPYPSPASPWRIVAYLALHGPTARQRLAGILWPEATQENAQGSLRSGLWRLQLKRPGIIDAQRGTLALPRNVTTDVGDLSRTAHGVLETGSFGNEDLARLLRTNLLLPEWQDEWITPERERLRQLHLHALESLADRLVDAGELALAHQVSLAELSADPLCEAPHRHLIRLHLLQGNLAAARQQYRSYAELLTRELGVAPNPSVRALFGAAGSDHTQSTPRGKAR